ncbi:hypothetical protein TUSST3_30710 [Streptomyces sp. TUS-ST3]|jgi:anti-sigma regulatory factor (Ser/Thr protein kinase)|nr:hypothetical protein TUSST3_30710 [Streptomyces sp. TUS-ST3]
MTPSRVLAGVKWEVRRHVGSDAEDCSGAEAYRARAGYALDGGVGCIAAARHHALAFLGQAQADHHLPVPDRVRDIVQLVVSELVTNALKYAPGPVLVEVRITAREVEIRVWDSDPAQPAARAADPGRIGQHGLEIVKAVTEDLVIEQQPVGKRITARILLTDTNDHSPA